ncbi:hypothetical protein [Bathymodiolus japonicus methanotrophic gill symbiont]|uniref:hypothetical protein n=1 Tax=Bathymodiolus japonicus methanotrophic gill symbiont TaxID=113269 RepID=UPI001C8DBF98|nr:hypothetical protein [Bathymodiolus japonicus methanotrophic gill symbiont]
MCSVCGGRRAAGASPVRCVGERITATGVPEFREVAWRAYDTIYSVTICDLANFTLKMIICNH